MKISQDTKSITAHSLLPREVKISEPKGTKPDVSVIVVSDYAGGEQKSWDDIRKTFGRLSEQTFNGAVETLLVEHKHFVDQIPQDLYKLIPDLVVIPSEHNESYLMKHLGVLVARAPFIAFLDADCSPDVGWLEAGVQSLRRAPDASVCSGLTNYPNRNRLERILSLTGRSHVCRRGEGYVTYIANNNAIYRREAYLQHPLRPEAGPFGGRLHAHELLRAGHRYYFQPAMQVIHDFDGPGMERDIRHSMGFATVRMRQLDKQLPFAWFVQLGVVSIPLFFFARLTQTWIWCLLYWHYHGVKVYELPLALVSAVRSHLYEISGMLTAFAGKEIGESAYR